MQRIFILLFCLTGFSAFAQTLDTLTVKTDSIPVIADPKYREDQFYATIAYNLMQGTPDHYSQYSFSTALGFGLLRDMPINKRRTYAIALGVGYSYSNIKHNLAVTRVDGKNTYEIVDKDNFDRNKLVLNYLDVPLELRWRNSNAISHQFWRVYLGLKLSYLFANKTQYEPDSNTTLKLRNDSNMNKVLYSTYMSFGYNTWNLYASYGITPLYNSATIDGQKIKMNSVKLGLIFYIL